MEEGRVTGVKELQEVKALHKRAEDTEELPGIKGKTLPQAVVGAFGYAEVLTQGKNRREPPGKPGVKKRDDKTQAVGGIRNQEGSEQGMGFFAGGAFEGADGYPAAAYGTLGIADKISAVGTVMAVGRSRGAAGRAGGSTAGEEFL